MINRYNLIFSGKGVFLLFIAFSFLKADIVTNINTIRKMDAQVRVFLDKINDIKDITSNLKEQYNCLKKDRNIIKCEKIGCPSTQQCLHTIFAQFQKIMDPIMLHLIGKITTGELKPGALTAIPLLWEDPKSPRVKKMQDLLVNNVALNFNDIYNFFGLMSKSLDTKLNVEEKKDTIAVQAQEPEPEAVPKKKKKRKKKKKVETEDTAANNPAPESTAANASTGKPVSGTVAK